MINPVHAFYQMRFFRFLCWKAESELIVEIYADIIDQLKRHFIGQDCGKFSIEYVYDDGSCKLEYKEFYYPSVYVLLKNIQEIK